MITIHHTPLDLTLVSIYKCKSNSNWFTKVNEMWNRLYQWCRHAHSYLSIDISRPAFFYCWITVRLISMQVLLCNAGYPPSWPILANQARHLLLAPLYEYSGENSSISLKHCRHDGIMADKLIYIWLLIYAAVCGWYMILLIRQDTCRWLPSQVPRPTCWWLPCWWLQSGGDPV